MTRFASVLLCAATAPAFGCAAQPAPATSSSPSSAASRAPRPRPDPAAPKTGHAAQASPRRFPRIQLVYISRPPNKRGTHKSTTEPE